MARTAQPLHREHPSTPPPLTPDAGLPTGNGDRDQPGQIPPEIVPGPNEPYHPAGTPDEVPGNGGDTDRPDSAPAETPPQPGITPGETPPPD